VHVVIADDSGLLRDGLTRLLAETGTEVVAAVGNALDLIATVDEHRPDLAVIDIRMPPTYTHEGARAAVELRERHPTLGILLLSQSLESRYVVDLVRAHPQRFGYLLKDRVVDVDVLVQAMHTIVAGGTVLDPAVVSHLMGNTGLADELERLSAREREVLDLMAQGRSNAAIAADLVIDLRTVESHIARIMTKLELHPTAPLAGAGESLAQGEVRALEESVAAQFPEALAVIGAERMNTERRAARLRVRDFEYHLEADSLRLRFALSAGSFATTVLREIIATDDTGE